MSGKYNKGKDSLSQKIYGSQNTYIPTETKYCLSLKRRWKLNIVYFIN